ncbi:MAG: hypothetical protein LBO04_03765 [Spirochaetaceae bacterium]|jgi:hypothetical protein|nr:hypothetical protein [Spirochaetaceae bacterium]
MGAPARAASNPRIFFRAVRNFDRALYLGSEALFEYRRGRNLDPYAKERLEHAEILKLQGYPCFTWNN